MNYRIVDLMTPITDHFSANYIDQSNRDFYATEGISEV